VVGYVWTGPEVNLDVPLSASWVSGTRSIRIVNSAAGTDHTYANVMSCTAGTIHPEQTDLNGVPGREILVHTLCPEMIAIDDARQAVYRWQIPLGVKRELLYADTDPGHGGTEITFKTTPFLATDPAVLTTAKLDGGNTWVGLSTLNAPSNAEFLAASDLDGLPGAEIAIVAGYAALVYAGYAGGLYESRRYDLPSWEAHFWPPVDTDGAPGAEIIVSRTFYPSSTSISIISHAARRTRDYAQGWRWFSQDFRDRDGSPGAEVCYSTGTGYRMIVDRVANSVPVTSCF
jgi:hypothetical protein